MSMSRRGRGRLRGRPIRQVTDWMEEYVPSIHYSWGPGTFCGTRRAKGNETKLTNQKKDVTCKNCLKKLNKGAFVEEHFAEEEDLFNV